MQFSKQQDWQFAFSGLIFKLCSWSPGRWRGALHNQLRTTCNVQCWNSNCPHHSQTAFRDQFQQNLRRHKLVSEEKKKIKDAHNRLNKRMDLYEAATVKAEVLTHWPRWQLVITRVRRHRVRPKKKSSIELPAWRKVARNWNANVTQTKVVHRKDAWRHQYTQKWETQVLEASPKQSSKRYTQNVCHRVPHHDTMWSPQMNGQRTKRFQKCINSDYQQHQDEHWNGTHRKWTNSDGYRSCQRTFFNLRKPVALLNLEALQSLMHHEFCCSHTSLRYLRVHKTLLRQLLIFFLLLTGWHLWRCCHAVMLSLPIFA